MSQEKVDKRKAEKSNRAKLMKRERIVSRIRLIVVIVILAVLVGWISKSAYTKIRSSMDRNMINADFSVMDDYASSLPQ